MKASVVIGANFGDEGKGLLVDYLSKRSEEEYPNSTSVIRFNSSGQCSHTVWTDNKKYFIFGHIGSGTLRNCATILSKHVVINSFLLDKEMIELEKNFFSTIRKPFIFVHKDCLITTIYDMWLNQVAERSRGSNNHGSCGIGFNETIVRSEKLPLTYDMLLNDKETFIKILNHIKDNYIIERLIEITNKSNIDPMYQKDISSFHESSEEREYENILKTMNIYCNPYDDNEFLKFVNRPNANFVFEGAQGLLLDQNNDEYFPNLTRSNTGLKNVLEIIGDLPMDKLDVYYVTRAYMTRHGAGRFDTEDKSVAEQYKCKTNKENRYQGIVRYGHLDVDLLVKSITRDITTNNIPEGTKFNLLVTCMDRINETVKIKHHGKYRNIPFESFSKLLKRALSKFNFTILESYGPVTPDTFLEL